MFIGFTIFLDNLISLPQVNAVKNEEANQVSKLNDEIRMLREKLAGQAGGSSSVSYKFFL